MAFSFCDQGDLEIAVGGAALLRQLADPNRTGQYNQEWIEDWLQSGASLIRASAEIKHDPETLNNLDVPSLQRLKKCNARLSAQIAYEDGAKGLAMPDWVRDRAEREEGYLEKLKNGDARLGRVAGGVVAAINQPAIGALDFDAADSLSVSKGGNASPSTSSSQAPSTSGISIAAFRQNGFR